MRPIWLYVLMFAALLAGCGATQSAAPPAQAPSDATATVDDVTDPTQGATMIAIATETAAALPQTTPTGAAAPEATPASTPEAAGAAPLLVSVHKTGGIAGVDELFAVYASGAAERRGRDGAATRGQLPAADVQALLQLLASPELASFSGSPMPPAADAFMYELKLPGVDGKEKTIVFSESSERPAVVDELLAKLQAMSDSVK
jgi:hypothetical protein